MIPGKGIYDSLPVWAQTLAVNLASRRDFRDKYGPDFHRFLAQLDANEKKSRDQLEADRQSALRELLQYAVTHVPFYREQKLPPDDFAAWPVLDKQAIAAMPEKFLSDEFDPRRLMTINTSGTTGTPLTVRFTKEYHQMEMAFRWRHKAWAGCPYLSSAVYLSGHPVVPPNQKRPPFWRIDRVEKRLLCSSYHLTLENLPRYIDAIGKYAPDFVHGYPSSVYLLAKQMLDDGVTTLRPRAVFTASETLLDFQRTAIERAFGTKAFNWYGTTEFTNNIIECAAGGLHHRLDYGVLELLEDGTMIATGLNNRAMPLIRYKVGDRATRREGTCPCGCAFPLIERIEGRVEDYVRTPDGRVVGRLDHVFKDVQHVREAQIVQTKTDELVLRIVRTDGFGPSDEQIMVKEAQLRLGNSIRIRFEFPDAIERTAAGKFRFVISELEAGTTPTIIPNDPPHESSQSERVRDLFNKRATAWSELYRENQKLVWRLEEFRTSLAKHIAPPAQVLDFGCGAGNLSTYLQQHGYRVTACDIAEKMIAEARQTFAGTDTEWVNLPTEWQHLPFGDSAFNGVIASSVFEYLEDLNLAFGELARVLRPGGVLVFSVPNMKHLERECEQWISRLTTPRWIHGPACSLPAVRNYLDYLRLSRNRFPLELWEQRATVHGFRSCLTDGAAQVQRPLLLLSLQKLP